MENLEKLHSSIERLLLGNPEIFGDNTQFNDLLYGLNHSISLLNSKDEYDNLMTLEVRLRLAMHFSPKEAINFKVDSDKVRWKLISKYLQEHDLKKYTGEIENLSRDIAKVLDLWDVSRKTVTFNRPDLFPRQEWRCNHCKLQYPENWDRTKQIYSMFKNDLFKPYIDEIDFQPEVDHIEPVSSLGRNEISNLHVLCRLCNQGKKEDFGIRAREEMKYAGLNINDIPKPYRWKMFYYVINRAKSICGNCKESDNELGVRLIRENGLYVRTNLKAICFRCIVKKYPLIVV